MNTNENEKTPIVEWDIDEATYVGDEEDGVYFQTGEGPDGWYVTVCVDSNSGAFCETIVIDDGPYKTQAEADLAGRDAALEWCINNEVDFGPEVQ